jgi:hypothetical protein
MSIDEPLDRFRDAASARAGLRGARAEQSLYSPFANLLSEVAAGLGHRLTVVDQVGTGKLLTDFGLFRAEHVVGWVELKSPDTDLDALRGHNLRQHERAKETLGAFILTNGWDWRLFVEGELVGQVVLSPDLLRDKAPVDPADPGRYRAVIATAGSSRRRSGLAYRGRVFTRCATRPPRVGFCRESPSRRLPASLGTTTPGSPSGSTSPSCRPTCRAARRWRAPQGSIEAGHCQSRGAPRCARSSSLVQLRRPTARS